LVSLTLKINFFLFNKNFFFDFFPALALLLQLRSPAATQQGQHSQQMGALGAGRMRMQRF